MRELFGNRDFRLLLSGQTLSMFGDWTLLLVFGIWGKTLTGSNSVAGLMVFAMSAPGLLGPLGGVLADRFRRRYLLIALNLLSAAVVLGLWFVHDRRQLWLLYTVAAWYGLSGTVFNAAISGLVQTMLPPPMLGRANGMLSSVRQGLRLVGPLVGAGLFASVGGGWVATLDAVTFVVSALALLALRTPETRPTRGTAPWQAELGAGFAHLRRSPVLRHLTIALMLCVAAFGLIEAAVFALVGTGLHRPPTFVAVVVSVQGIGAIAGGIAVTAAVRWLREATLVVAALLLAAVAVATATVPTLPTVLTGAALLGAALPIITVAATTLLQRSTPNAIMGRVTAAFDAAANVPYTLSIAAGAALIGVFPYQAILATIAA